MARPKKDEVDKLTEVMHFRVSKKVRDAFIQKHIESNLTISEFLRELLDDKNEKVTIIAKERKEKTPLDVRRVVFLANKTSNNINQLAHKVNSHHMAGLVNDKLYEDILRSLCFTNEILSGFIREVN